MQSATRAAPKAWTADEVRQDACWIQRLSAAAIDRLLSLFALRQAQLSRQCVLYGLM